jgi:hypothetical protein
MTEERAAQIIAALEWATGHSERTSEAKNSGFEETKLMIYERRGGGNGYCVFVKDDVGTDFTAMIDAEERKKDEAEYSRLKSKLAKDEE